MSIVDATVSKVLALYKKNKDKDHEYKSLLAYMSYLKLIVQGKQCNKLSDVDMRILAEGAAVYKQIHGNPNEIQYDRFISLLQNREQKDESQGKEIKMDIISTENEAQELGKIMGNYIYY